MSDQVDAGQLGKGQIGAGQPAEARAVTRVATPPVRPAPTGYDSWTAYWAEQEQPWRTQPEIDRERQRLLSRHRYNITHDIVQGHYPFKDVRLDRADIEWLLASHASDGGHGPVEASDVDARRGL